MYLFVQISLICLFLQLDFDFLCSSRTAPYHSWCNPVERVIAILNLGIQCVSLARTEMPEAYESEIRKCNTLGELRKIAEKKKGFESIVQDRLSNVKVLLCSIFSRLTLKDKSIRIFHLASNKDISQFWSAILALENTMEQHEKYNQGNVTDYPNLRAFINHCCQVEHYTFGILKCGKSSCSICKLVRLPSHVFGCLRHLPHPVPGEDGHYLPFSEVIKRNITGEFRPSLQKKILNVEAYPTFLCQCTTR